MKKIFISYSNDNLEHKITLEQYLSTLKRDNLIDVWQSGLITTGEKWNDKIIKSLEESDIVIMLITQSFIDSSYIQDIEVSKALRKVSEESGKIYPILLKNCDWQNWKAFPENMDKTKIEKDGGRMGAYQFAPMDKQRLKPLNRWHPYEEDAWVQIAQEIRAMVE